jgi:hypothetical protein
MDHGRVAEADQSPWGDRSGVGNLDALRRFDREVVGLESMRRFDHARCFRLVRGYGGPTQVLAPFDGSQIFSALGPVPRQSLAYHGADHIQF